jgi:hypothetical protein
MEVESDRIEKWSLYAASFVAHIWCTCAAKCPEFSDLARLISKPVDSINLRTPGPRFRNSLLGFCLYSEGEAICTSFSSPIQNGRESIRTNCSDSVSLRAPDINYYVNYSFRVITSMTKSKRRSWRLRLALNFRFG